MDAIGGLYMEGFVHHDLIFLMKAQFRQSTCSF